MTVSTHLMRRAGILYLSVALLGGFAHFVVRGTIYERGDATATAANVLDAEVLLRVGLIADLAQATIFVILALTLYRLFESVDRHAASELVVFAAMATTAICLNLAFQYAALAMGSNGAYGDALGSDGAEALVSLWFDIHSHGYLIAQIFFGLWLVPLGRLVRHACHFPTRLGSALMAAGVVYVIGTLIEFTFSGLGEPAITLIYLPSGAAELWMIASLLRTAGQHRQPERVATSAPTTAGSSAAPSRS